MSVLSGHPARIQARQRLHCVHTQTLLHMVTCSPLMLTFYCSVKTLLIQRQNINMTRSRFWDLLAVFVVVVVCEYNSFVVTNMRSVKSKVLIARELIEDDIVAQMEVHHLLTQC